MTRTFELVPTSEGTDLVVTGPWNAQAAKQVISGRATGIVLNYARGFQERSLEFLRSLRLQRIHLLARTILDLSPIYASAATLTSLRLQSHDRSVLDLVRFPQLRQLSAGWSQVRDSIGQATMLDRLDLSAYAEPDLTPLSTLTSLTSLRLEDRPRVVSLDGLEALPWLQHLSVSTAAHLSDITALHRMSSPVLQILELESDPHIPDLNAIANCTGLTYLNAGNCGDLPDAEPLSELHALETLYLYESTRFLDGDLTPIPRLRQLRDFRMMNRRHYTPAVSAIQNEMTARQGQ